MSFFTLLGLATGDTGLGMMMDRLLEKNDKPAAQAVAPNVEPITAPRVVAPSERLRPAEPTRERVQYYKSSSGEYLTM